MLLWTGDRDSLVRSLRLTSSTPFRRGCGERQPKRGCRATGGAAGTPSLIMVVVSPVPENACAMGLLDAQGVLADRAGYQSLLDRYHRSANIRL